MATSAAAVNVHKQDSATITTCKPENVADATAELRGKRKSKMEVGKFFAGIITLLLGILLKDALGRLKSGGAVKQHKLQLAGHIRGGLGA